MVASAHIEGELSVSGVPAVALYFQDLGQRSGEIAATAAERAAAFMSMQLEDALEGDPLWAMLVEELEVRPSPDGMLMIGVVDEDPVVTDMVWRMEYGEGHEAPQGLLRMTLLENLHWVSQAFQKALDAEVARG